MARKGMIDLGGETAYYDGEEPKKEDKIYPWPHARNIIPNNGAVTIREVGEDLTEIQRLHRQVWGGYRNESSRGREDYNLPPSNRPQMESRIEGNHFNSIFFDDITAISPSPTPGTIPSSQAIWWTNPIDSGLWIIGGEAETTPWEFDIVQEETPRQKQIRWNAQREDQNG